MLIRLLDTLKKPDAEISDFVTLIEQDPVFAAQILKTVNSPQYVRADGEILSLYRAICILGFSGVSNIATRILMSKVLPCEPAYYQKFGRQIWTHSVQCASLCMTLSAPLDKNEFDAYFLGLIHDLGKIIIFNCLCEALSTVLVDCIPNTKVFKELMSEMSTDITYHVAMEWHLPHIYCQALKEQNEQKKSDLAIVLDKANQLCEAHLMYERGLLTDEQIAVLLEQLSIDSDIWSTFIETATEIDSLIN